MRESVRAAIADLTERVQTLEATVSTQRDRIDELETENEQLRNRLDGVTTDLDTHDEALTEHDETLADHADTLQEHDKELTRLDSLSNAAINKASTNKDRIAELQSRELQKGAHLDREHVDPGTVTVPGDELEAITKEGGRYYRVPESDDPLDRSGSITLSHGDLLPIQQLARMDDHMLDSATNTAGAELAAKVWRARSDPTVGYDPWQQGSRTVQEHLTASELRHWIRRRRPEISHDYAQKLVSRTIDALLRFSNHRLGVTKTTERKNGLSYEERRVILPTDAEIPGERGTRQDDPPTAGVHG